MKIAAAPGATSQGARPDDPLTSIDFTLLPSRGGPTGRQTARAPRGESSSDQDAIVVGHNVTPTTATLKQGVVTAGNYAVAVGLTDSIFIATSPWIWTSYNTANLHAKWGTDLDPHSRLSFFASYFESYDSAPLTSEIGTASSSRSGGGAASPVPRRSFAGAPSSATTGAVAGPSTGATLFETLDRYQWQSASLHALYSHDLFSFAKLNLNLQYGYFWNDDFPYSIRMDPGSDAIHGQVDFTSLTQIRLWHSGFHYLFEIGALGLNYIYPYMQIGSSLAYLSRAWLVQIGASATMQFREVTQMSGWIPGRYDSRQHYSQSAQRFYYERYLQTALHPEIQLQYFF